MAKIFSLLFSFILGTFKSPNSDDNIYEKLVDRALDQLKYLLESLALTLTGFTLVIAGFLTAYFNLLHQYDERGSIALNAVSIGGFVLVGVGIIILFSTLSQKKIDRHLTSGPKIAAKTSPLEEAISLLVLDYVKEREIDRERSHQAKTSPPKPEDIIHDTLNPKNSNTHAEYFSRHGSV